MRFAILALILLPIATAQVQLFDKWVEEGDSFKLGDFKIETIWTGNSAFLSMEGSEVDVPLGQCRKMLPFDICIEDTRLTLDGEVVPDTINSQDTMTEMKIVVTGLLSELELTRTFEKTRILINEQIEVRVEMRNTDVADATDVAYEDSYPNDVELSDAEGCSIQGNDIVWSGIIRKGNYHVCTYKIKALKDKVFTSKGELEYYNGMQEKKVVRSQRIDIPDYALELDLDSRTSKAISGDPIEIEVFVKNNNEVPLDVRTLQFIIPKAFNVISPGELDNKGFWTGDIIDNLTFTLVLEAARTGTHYINATALYYTEDVRQIVSEYKKFTISTDVFLEINDEIAAPRQSQPGHAKLELFNPGAKSLLDVTAEITSDIPGFVKHKQTRDSVGQKNTFVVLDDDITIETPGTYTINLTVSYKNSLGEEFTRTEEYSVQVGGTSSTETQNPQAAEPGEETAQEPEHRFSMPQSGSFDFGTGLKSNGLYLVLAVIILAFILIYLRYKIKND